MKCCIWYLQSWKMNGGQGTSMIKHFSDSNIFENQLNELCTAFLITQLLTKICDEQWIRMAGLRKAMV